MNTPRTKRAMIAAGAWLVSTCGLSRTLADEPSQPAPPPPPAAQHAGTRDGEHGPVDRTKARELMQQRLDTLRKQSAAMEEAIGMLDRGEPIEAVRKKAAESITAGFGAMRQFREQMHERRGEEADERGRSGPGNHAGPPDGPDGDAGARGPHRAGPMAGLVDGSHGGHPCEEPLPVLQPGETPPQPVVDKMLAFLKQNRPEMAERIEKLRREDPEQFHQFLRERGAQIVGMMRDQAEDPEVWSLREKAFEADRATRRAARAYHTASGEQRDAALKALRDAASAQFDARAEVSRAEIRKSKAWAERLESQLDERLSSREKYIDDRMKELTSAPAQPRNDGPRGKDGSTAPGDGANGAPRSHHPPGGGQDLFDDGDKGPKPPPPQRSL